MKTINECIKFLEEASNEKLFRDVSENYKACLEHLKSHEELKEDEKEAWRIVEHYKTLLFTTARDLGLLTVQNIQRKRVYTR